MWPPGHVAIAYLLYRAYVGVRPGVEPSGVPVLVLVFGSLLPDLVDKPLAWYLGAIPTGRTLAHSLFVLVPLSVAIYLLARRYGRDEYGGRVRDRRALTLAGRRPPRSLGPRDRRRLPPLAASPRRVVRDRPADRDGAATRLALGTVLPPRVRAARRRAGPLASGRLPRDRSARRRRSRASLIVRRSSPFRRAIEPARAADPGRPAVPA
jgi:hypothetical protein